jgi:hypothetical protein
VFRIGILQSMLAALSESISNKGEFNFIVVHSDSFVLRCLYYTRTRRNVNQYLTGVLGHSGGACQGQRFVV